MGKKKEDKPVDGSRSVKAAPKGKISGKTRIFIIGVIVLSVIFLPTSMLLFFGMLPSLVAVFISFRGVGARASTVTAMNLAGCIPFVFKVWSHGNDFESSFDIITNMKFMTVIYMAAAFGYMIDWVVTGLVSSFMYQKAQARVVALEKRQQALIAEWGQEVTGEVKAAG